MKEIDVLLSELRQAEVQLWVEEGRLRYRANKGSLTPELLAQMREHKAEILAFLKNTATNSSLPPLLPVPREHELPLSFAQQRFWFLHQFEPDSSANNMPVVVRLTGSLNVAALEQSLTEVVRRHEVLRTIFPSVNGQARQVIGQPQPIALPTIDLQLLPSEQRNAEAFRLATAEAHRPFDVVNERLLRVLLLRLSDTEHLFVWNMHCMICDGASSDVLYQDLTALYVAFSQGKPSPLPELPIQYADFAHWQRQWLQGDVLESQLRYWKQKLEGTLSAIQLPTDHVRPPAVQTYRGDRGAQMLPKTLNQALSAFSQQSGATLFMTLLTAFKILLYRYSGQQDLLISFASAGRAQVETERLIGFFSNTLVLRTDLAGNPSFRELLDRVKAGSLEAYAHQDIPFEKLIEELPPDQSHNRSPLFQVKFALNPPWSNGRGMASVKLPDLTITSLFGYIYHGKTKYDLMLVMREQDEGLGMVFDYNSELFEASTIARMLGHFRTLLEGIVANPNQRLSELPLLTAEEQQQLEIWNNPQTPLPQSVCLHQLFEAQVERTPNEIALIDPFQKFTYRQLNDRANQLAHFLQRLGVQPGDLIGVCLDRSTAATVGLMGILKAGGAYLSVEPQRSQDLPDGVSFWLTQQPLAENFAAKNLRVVCLDTDWSAIEQCSSANPNNCVTGDSIAYIAEASGQNVSLSHGNMVQQVASQDFVHLSSQAVFLQLAAFSSSRSVFEVWGCLLNGAKLVLPPQLPSLQDLGQIIEQFQVTTLWLESRWFNRLIDEQLETLGSVRQILISGESVSSSHVQAFLHVSNAQLIRVYGAPETTSIACCYTISDSTHSNLPTLIGKPIAHTQTYVLDDYLQPVAVGVVGELYVGGSGLAQGYFNNAELTAERFIANPFAAPGTRLYKTGDFARHLPDGTLERIGRIDQPVHIQGIRVELGKIEAVLNRHPNIQEHCVVVQPDRGHDRLVAYIVLRSKSTLPSELYNSLKQTLPIYMVPALLVLEALPLTIDGTIDYAALPQPDLARSGLEDGLPRTAIEQQIAEVWAEVLHLEQTDIHANFFELGGHSLLAIQVIIRLQQVLQIEVPLRSLFEAPTVAKLAEFVQANHPEDVPLASLGARSTIPRISRQENLRLSFAQQRLWFIDQLESASSTYNIPVAYCLTGKLNLPALQQSLQAIVNRHETLRTCFSNASGEPIQMIAAEISLPLAIVDLENYPSQQAAEVQRQVTEVAQQPFDLTQASLVRFRILRLSETEHLLVVVMHHIISDGWSLEVFFRELTVFYQAFATGQSSPLPNLPIQYVDFAYWQRQWLQGDVLQSQLSYWKQQLGGDLPVLQLPIDHLRPPVQTYRGAVHQQQLPERLTEALKAVSQEAGTTLAMTLLAAFKVLLHRYSGQDDILVGSPIAGRNQLETEGLIGFFVNTLVLRSDLSGNPSFRELLHRVREVSLEAYAHQDLPFEKLVEELKPDRDLSRSPLFQVVFIMNPPWTKGTSQDQSGLTIAPSSLQVQTGTSKFDLTLAMRDTGNGLSALFEYSTDLFDEATIVRMQGHLQTLLEGIVANPDQRLSALPLLTTAEQQCLLVEWNQTQTAYPKDAAIHQLFEAQVKQTPDAIALILQDQSLTYQELNDRANQLAHSLRALGVDAEALVGICLDRSIDMIVGLLAILKAGGAYVPLDPAYPPERLAYMMADAQLAFLLTEQAFLEKLPNPPAKTLCMDASWTTIRQESRENLTHAVKADHLAYVMYTSGSTGNPKGVKVIHQGVVRLVQDTNYVNLSAAEVFLQLAPIAFDASTLEIWGCLLNGARLVLSPAHTCSLAEIGQVIQHNQITILWLTAGLFHLMVDEQLERLKSVRQLLAGGDVLSVSHVQKFLQQSENSTLINGYGPTENTTFTCCYPIVDGTQIETSVPIGRPISNTQVFVLDGSFNPVPIGVPGELYVGGDGLAQGYLNRPELTEQKFIANPFSDRPHDRLYKTGDLVRYRADGTLEFLGRLDNQVKIRGFRIELGEIETVLSRCPKVREAAIVVQTQDSDKRLVAYVVPNSEQLLTSQELRAFLKETLPDYMVPSIFMLLDALPLTPNGKIDRRALPSASPSPAVEDTFVAPQDELELQLTQIWQDVLSVESIGIHDNFFELGGHSLLGVRLVAQIEKALHQSLSVASLFQAPTIEQLATVLRKQGWTNPWHSLVPIQPKGSQPPLFCIHVLGRGLQFFRPLAKHLGIDQPLYGLSTQMTMNQNHAPANRVEDLAAHYIQEMRLLQPEGPYFLTGLSFGGIIAYEMAQQLNAQGQKVALLALLDTYGPGAIKHLPTQQRTSIHWQNFLKFGPTYVLEKAMLRGRERIHRLNNQIANWRKKAMLKAHLSSGRALPSYLQDFTFQKQDAQASRSYVAKPYPGRVTVFRAIEQDKTTGVGYYRDAGLGWGELAAEGVEIYAVPGSHLSMVQEPNVEVLAQEMKALLDRTQVNL